jgi:hypothetical protein
MIAPLTSSSLFELGEGPLRVAVLTSDEMGATYKFTFDQAYSDALIERYY